MRVERVPAEVRALIGFLLVAGPAFFPGMINVPKVLLIVSGIVLLVTTPWPAQEGRRKLIHMLGAFGPFVSIKFFGWLGSVSILLFLTSYVLFGGLLNLRGLRLPVIGALIQRTERATELLPVGALEYLFAVLVIGTLFHEPWFFPAIAVLAFGDGAAGLVGVAWGRTKLPWNRKKSWEGLVGGILVGVFAAMVAGVFAAETHESRWEYEPLLDGDWYVAALFSAVGFGLVVLGTHVGARRLGVTLTSNSSWRVTVAVAAACWLVSLLPFVLAAGEPPVGPLVDYLPDYLPDAHNFTPFVYLIIPVVLVMLAESFLRGHDNLVVPILFVVLYVWLTRLDPFEIVSIGNT